MEVTLQSCSVTLSGVGVTMSRTGQWILCLTLEHIGTRKLGLALHINIAYISGEMEGSTVKRKQMFCPSFGRFPLFNV